MAASIHRPEILDFLLKQGADAVGPTNDFSKTALMYAAQHDELQAVTQLLAAGADPNAKTKAEGCPGLNRDHRTPLMYAAENSHTASLQLLSDNGADSCAKDTQGNDLSFYADRNAVDNSVPTWVASQLRACATNATQ